MAICGPEDKIKMHDQGHYSNPILAASSENAFNAQKDNIIEEVEANLHLDSQRHAIGLCTLASFVFTTLIQDCSIKGIQHKPLHVSQKTCCMISNRCRCTGNNTFVEVLYLNATQQTLDPSRRTTLRGSVDMEARQSRSCRRPP